MTAFYLDTTRSDNPLDSNLANDPDKANANETPAFLTLQSLTYSGAMVAIGIVWALAQNIAPGQFTQGPLVPVLASVLIMFAGLAQVWADLADAGKKIAAALIATFNAAMLTAGALGITAITQTALNP
jgi:hypothetical protein